MHDARWFEAEGGVPAVAVVSDGFVKQARYQAKILHASLVPQVFVPHPISDQSAQQMHAKADVSFEDVFRAITQVWTPPALAPAEEEEEEEVGPAGDDGDAKSDCDT
jgi:hypothetical protein